MKSILVIAQNTYREIFRDRILYGLIVFAVLLIFVSIALGELSFSEQSRITINFGFTAIHLSAMILSIFVGSTLVAREIEKKTIMTLFVRPITRAQFVVGKSLGLLAVIGASILILTTVLIGILFIIEQPLAGTFFIGLLGILLEAMLILSVTLFFGTFSSPILAVSFSIGVFLIGHWLDSLKYFTEKSDSALFQAFGKLVARVVPNLEYFNWRALFVYNSSLPVGEIPVATVYALAWTSLLVALAATILSRRDFN